MNITLELNQQFLGGLLLMYVSGVFGITTFIYWVILPECNEENLYRKILYLVIKFSIMILGSIGIFAYGMYLAKGI